MPSHWLWEVVTFLENLFLSFWENHLVTGWPYPTLYKRAISCWWVNQPLRNPLPPMQPVVGQWAVCVGSSAIGDNCLELGVAVLVAGTSQSEFSLPTGCLWVRHFSQSTFAYLSDSLRWPWISKWIFLMWLLPVYCPNMNVCPANAEWKVSKQMERNLTLYVF
jgi:hypothetical protein